MKLFTKALLLLLIMAAQIVSAQSDKAKAHELGEQAVKLEDDGKFEDAIKLLEQAQKLDPDNYSYPYEMAYSYHGLKDYKKAIEITQKLTKHKNADDQAYQMLGNIYDEMGKPDKALETYDEGLKVFPKSGKLYLEKGNVYWGKEEYDKALPFYEKGIMAEPRFPSNYYRATRLYCSSSEEVWGMIYGEMFMNMERNSQRTAEISKKLFDTYKKAIQITSDTGMSVSFSKNATININDLKDTANLKLPFGVGVYEPLVLMSMTLFKPIDMETLDEMRSAFVDHYFENKNYSKQYPCMLFDYQKKVKDAGHMSAYNHWILMKGDEDAFTKWQDAHKAQWDAFITWFGDNKMKVDDSNKFSSGLY
jgi:tetratricopeptide (TPR) repeat protein